MIRFASAALAAVGLSAVWLAPGAAQNGGGQWGTIKGRIVWGGKKLPERKKITVTQDKDHCLAKGDLYDNEFEVDPKTKGLKDVFVSLKAAPGGKLMIHPSLTEIKDKEVVMDQPRCLFSPRAVAIRKGQTLIARNSSPVQHNFNYSGISNSGQNLLIPPGKEIPLKDLKVEPRIPIGVSCGIHPWMRGMVAVYNHPYFAVTKADGSFEIKLAPAGMQRLVIYKEGIGWRGGAKGAKDAGEPITVKAGGVTDLGELKMAPRE